MYIVACYQMKFSVNSMRFHKYATTKKETLTWEISKKINRENLFLTFIKVQIHINLSGSQQLYLARVKEKCICGNLKIITLVMYILQDQESCQFPSKFSCSISLFLLILLLLFITKH